MNAPQETGLDKKKKKLRGLFLQFVCFAEKKREKDYMLKAKAQRSGVKGVTKLSFG